VNLNESHVCSRLFITIIIIHVTLLSSKLNSPVTEKLLYNKLPKINESCDTDSFVTKSCLAVVQALQFLSLKFDFTCISAMTHV
jgi:hypothetical protein